MKPVPSEKYALAMVILFLIILIIAWFIFLAPSCGIPGQEIAVRSRVRDVRSFSEESDQMVSRRTYLLLDACSYMVPVCEESERTELGCVSPFDTRSGFCDLGIQPGDSVEFTGIYSYVPLASGDGYRLFTLPSSFTLGGIGYSTKTSTTPSPLCSQNQSTT